MDYEEKIIDGVLHFRNTPKGKFQAYSLEELTAWLINEQCLKECYKKEIELSKKIVKEIKQILRIK